ncbi:MAG TPA: type VI secretion system contractile sheath large subunit [Polyangiaceae bacterium]|nr:type VI secretion system contractile sheath large subunit [Polyangiaceae bacterium]
MRFDFRLAQGPRPSSPTPHTPFRILVLGDFEGRSSRGVTRPAADRRPVRLDMDTLDEFLGRLGAEAEFDLPGASAPTRVGFATIDDLHPDRLFACVDRFSDLRKTRQGLLDPTTFAAAADVGSDSDTLQRLLGRRASPATTTAARTTDPVADIIRPLVAGHVVPGPPSDQQARVAAVDAAIGETMRRVLHAPAFQALESAWRGLEFLLRRIETGESLQIYALNLSKEDLLADLSAAGDLEQTALFRILVESAMGSLGANPWALILGFCSFSLDPRDLESLARMATLAQAAGAPFVAAASGELLKTVLQSPERVASEDGWMALRAAPSAAYLGLVGPRFLLRLPYGRSTEPVSAFAFEELPDGADHEAYLWAPPAAALGVFVATMFVESGWGMSLRPVFDLAGLPVHVHKEGGEAVTTPCAETWLTDSQAEALARHGVIPLQSIRGRDAVRIASVPSLREPAVTLAGRWD